MSKRMHLIPQPRMFSPSPMATMMTTQSTWVPTPSSAMTKMDKRRTRTRTMGRLEWRSPCSVTVEMILEGKTKKIMMRRNNHLERQIQGPPNFSTIMRKRRVFLPITMALNRLSLDRSSKRFGCSKRHQPLKHPLRRPQ